MPCAELGVARMQMSLGFRFQSSGFRVQDLGFRAYFQAIDPSIV